MTIIMDDQVLDPTRAMEYPFQTGRSLGRIRLVKGDETEGAYSEFESSRKCLHLLPRVQAHVLPQHLLRYPRPARTDEGCCP
jgi:hypothetical protein